MLHVFEPLSHTDGTVGHPCKCGVARFWIDIVNWLNTPGYFRDVQIILGDACFDSVISIIGMSSIVDKSLCQLNRVVWLGIQSK